MEPFLADFLNNPKIPKVIRYAIITIIGLFVLCVGISCVVRSPMVIGKIFGIILCILTLMATIYIFKKIHNN